MDSILSMLFNVNLRAAEIRAFFSTSLLPWPNHLQGNYAVMESLWLAWLAYDRESWVQFLQPLIKFPQPQETLKNNEISDGNLFRQLAKSHLVISLFFSQYTEYTYVRVSCMNGELRFETRMAEWEPTKRSFVPKTVPPHCNLRVWMRNKLLPRPSYIIRIYNSYQPFSELKLYVRTGQYFDYNRNYGYFFQEDQTLSKIISWLKQGQSNFPHNYQGCMFAQPGK